MHTLLFFVLDMAARDLCVDAVYNVASSVHLISFPHTHSVAIPRMEP